MGAPGIYALPEHRTASISCVVCKSTIAVSHLTALNHQHIKYERRVVDVNSRGYSYDIYDIGKVSHGTILATFE